MASKKKSTEDKLKDSFKEGCEENKKKDVISKSQSTAEEMAIEDENKKLKEKIKLMEEDKKKKEEELNARFDRLERATDLKKDEKVEKKLEKFSFAFKPSVKIASFLLDNKRIVRGKDATGSNPLVATDAEQAKLLEDSGFFNRLD